MNTVIFDVGNVLVGYDWESYLRSFHYSEEIYQRIADAVFLKSGITEPFEPGPGITDSGGIRRI